ncbi:MAG TPA: glucans biosynthesis glucosyltransferase MdoH, partial [Opitutaceae bacterium]|nr:glucans biosynthesis glucosyltransferase MdoH [Opitutaceae bacterium]
LATWADGTANYYGHNAAVRVNAFLECCALPVLAGQPPLGGHILSHDFVEAALLCRAGWEVRIAYDLSGSWEELPPTLPEYVARDRRWCQGNMQHTWLLTARGFRMANRFHLFMGVMAYVSSPLWLLFLFLGMIEAFRAAGEPHSPDTTSLFGYRVQLPEALTLFLFTMLLLYLPKIVSVVSALGRPGEAERFGGRGRLVASAVLEAAASTLFAPIAMMFNTRFVLFTLLGQGVSWIAQQRRADDDGTDWREAILTHGVQTIVGVIWGLAALVLLPSYFWWLSPVIAGLVLAVPMSIFFSKASLGRQARELGFFLTPEETEPPRELKQLRKNLAECYRHLPPFEPLRADYGLMQAVLDPYINAMHVALLRQRRASEEAREWFGQLRQRLLREGPAGFSPKEKMALLLDADSMIWLHRELWTCPAESLAEWWRLAMRQYNVLTATPTTALYR